MGPDEAAEEHEMLTSNEGHTGRIGKQRLCLGESCLKREAGSQHALDIASLPAIGILLFMEMQGLTQ